MAWSARQGSFRLQRALGIFRLKFSKRDGTDHIGLAVFFNLIIIFRLIRFECETSNCRGRAKNCNRIASTQAQRAMQYQYRDRKNRKREFRKMWIQQINAGAKEHGVSLCQTVLISNVRPYFLPDPNLHGQRIYRCTGWRCINFLNSTYILERRSLLTSSEHD